MKLMSAFVTPPRVIPRAAAAVGRIAIVCITFSATALSQQPPYDVFPPAEPPYYRVRYEASTRPGELIYPANYTIWIPRHVKLLRGVIVHQHGCGEGSCKSGLTGAFDLHWQSLAKKHDCAFPVAGSSFVPNVHTVNDSRTKDGKPAQDPDGGPLKRTFSVQDRTDLQRIAWEGLKQFRQLAASADPR